MTSSVRNPLPRSSRDRRFDAVLTAAASVSALVLGLVVLFLMIEALPAWRSIGAMRFLTDEGWHPTEDRFGLGPMILGSLLVTAGAIAIAAPIGWAAGVFVQLYLPVRGARAYRQAMALLAGVPSVVLGLFGLLTLVPRLAAWQPPGASWLAGSLVLAIMILPTIVLSTDAAFGAVSPDLRRAAAALGLGRWTFARRVAWPVARPATGMGIFQALARAIGETMVVLMVCGNVPKVPASVFDPVRTLTANIALEMGYATRLHRSALFVGGLGLVLAIAGVLIAAWLLDRRSAEHA